MARTVLITGAAGNLGRAVADSFERAGDSVVLVDRSAEVLERAFAGSGAERMLVAVDLLQADDVEQAVGRVAAQFGRIDVLCNLAGGFAMGTPVHATADADWQRMQDLNVRTVLNMARAVVPLMVQRGRGKIVNVGANAARRGAAHMGAYIASKAEVLRLTETMAAELREQGINVNCVMPSIIDTPQNRADMPDADPKRWVSPEQLAAVIAFLASDAADAVHGACIPVTGLS
ncbi:SDR family NAD(P)-dependent oxidoreductase [Ramlibacter terrae]|uniref:SDR family NAD(P)-dependent oxidoreductase n=1 Tax=Ramlibacter terrae TaxID=2732511 RepID=A0ABX6P406_9BURK|nr:SDR family NAD(P)-dependent oxidoreductase [Ramlibacter terrae]